MFQLPPVRTRYIFEKPLNERFWLYYNISPLWEEFKVTVLKYNHHQGEGSSWTQLLNRVRLGCEALTASDKELLKSRCVSIENVDHEVLHAYHSNAEVAEYNSRMLNKVDKTLYTIMASIKAPLGLKSRITITDDGKVGSTAFLKQLDVKVGARVTLIFNVWTFDGLVNGVMGTIVGISWSRQEDRVEYIAVDFDNPKAGRNQRLKYPRQAAKYSARNGTPIFRHEMDFNLKGSTSAYGTVIQFPLKLGWASTSHKLQVAELKAKFTGQILEYYNF